ncbi:MAG: signal peptide peptidase SppA [Planctomycetota bacterium]
MTSPGSLLTLLLSSALVHTLPALADESAKPLEQAEKQADKPADKPAAQAEKPPAKTRVDWAEITLKGSLPEAAAAPGMFGSPPDSLPSILDRLSKAAADKAIHGVLLDIRSLDIGWARLHELRTAIAAVKATGKPVWARMDDADNKQYILAAACDRILMPESGTLALTGLRAEVTFYRNLFDMLSIQPDMLRVGAFKSAAEPYTRTEMSPEFRQEMEEILDDHYRDMVAQVATARKLTEERVREIIDVGLIPASEARDLGLIDVLAYEDQLKALIAGPHQQLDVRIREDYRKEKVSTELDLFSLMKILSGPKPATGSRQPRIAVLTLEGSITSGSDPTSLLSGGGGINSDRIVPIIHKLAEDEHVKAIVLRVDSPGGSALASDLIWRALESSGKPVVASMGDVAASGGYYISMGAEAIFAEPGTVTGSIGVLGGKIALEGLMNKLGVTTSVISRGKNSGVMSMTTGFTDSERTAMQRMLNETYDQFTRKAAAGRRMEHAALEALARGRVYTGRQAKEIGLVDHLGTLADAIAHARQLAGDPEGKLELEQLPPAGSPLEGLIGQQPAPQPPLAQALQLLPPSLHAPLQHLPALELLHNEPVLLMLPYHLHVH